MTETTNACLAVGSPKAPEENLEKGGQTERKTAKEASRREAQTKGETRDATSGWLEARARRTAPYASRPASACETVQFICGKKDEWPLRSTLSPHVSPPLCVSPFPALGTPSTMLAPIITKDMKLFPTRPLPPHVKNVRSRAQSLDQMANGVVPPQSRPKPVGPRPPKSQSVGNLPLTSVSTSPPKGATASRKTTLPVISEGVEMGSREAKSMPPRPNTSASTSSSVVAAEDNISTNSAPALDKDPKEKKSVVRWIKDAFSSKDKEEKEKSRKEEKCLKKDNS